MEMIAYFYAERATLWAHFFPAFSMAPDFFLIGSFNRFPEIWHLCALGALLHSLLQKSAFSLFREVVGHFGNYIL
jgi:hypothetical protein